MHKIIVAALLFTISFTTSSCFYYKSLPKEWKSQICAAENIASFNGRYKLSDDNESLSDDEEYNDLRYFQDTVIYGVHRIYIPNLTSVGICTTNNGVHVELFREKKLVHETHFETKSTEFKNGALKLDLKNQSAAGGLCQEYNAPTVTLYNTTNDEVIIRYQETFIGTAIIVPVIGGQNLWFKLKRIDVSPSCP